MIEIIAHGEAQVPFWNDALAGKPDDLQAQRALHRLPIRGWAVDLAQHSSVEGRECRFRFAQGVLHWRLA